MQLLLSSPLLERRWYEPDIVKQQAPFNISIAHDTHHIPTMVGLQHTLFTRFFFGDVDAYPPPSAHRSMFSVVFLMPKHHWESCAGAPLCLSCRGRVYVRWRQD